MKAAELFRHKAVEEDRHVVFRSFFSPVVTHHLPHADRGENEQEPDDEVRIVPRPEGKALCQVEEKETESVHEAADIDI